MAVNATVFLSDDTGAGTCYDAETITYPAEAKRGPFVCTSLTVRKGGPGHSQYVGIVSIHANKAADLGRLIAELGRARDWLAAEEANAAERARHQRESEALAEPHHEDGHSDSAPHA